MAEVAEPTYPTTDEDLEEYLAALPKPGPLRDAWNRVSYPVRWFWGMVWADYTLCHRGKHWPQPGRSLHNLRWLAHCARTAFPLAVWLCGRMFK